MRQASNADQARRLVRALYLGMLHREQDAESAAGWVRALVGGMGPADVAEAFLNCEEFRKDSGVKLWVAPGHFYSPIVDPVEAERELRRVESIPPPAALASIHIDAQEMARTWQELVPLLSTAPFGAVPVPPLNYAYENPNYRWGDGIVLQAMIRFHRPKRIIEIGSGWSSACTVDTVRQYLDGACDLTFIEPHPELLRSLVGMAESRVRIVGSKVQEVPLETFDQLEHGDILFIDSTHVLRTGSDVCFELFEVLPRLAPGVLVHLHDMFWPFEYPRSWVIDENRSWNELYAVRAFLSGNKDWRIVMFNDYFGKLHRPLIERTVPAFLNSTGGALWLERRS